MRRGAPMYVVVDDIFTTRYFRVTDPSRFPSGDAVVIGTAAETPFITPVLSAAGGGPPHPPRQSWARCRGTKLALRSAVPVDIAAMARLYGLVPGQRVVDVGTGMVHAVLGCDVAEGTSIVAHPIDVSPPPCCRVVVLVKGCRLAPRGHAPQGGDLKAALLRALPTAALTHIATSFPGAADCLGLASPVESASSVAKDRRKRASASSSTRPSVPSTVRSDPLDQQANDVGQRLWLKASPQTRERFLDLLKPSVAVNETPDVDERVALSSCSSSYHLIDSDPDIVNAVYNVSPDDLLWNVALRRTAVVLGVVPRRALRYVTVPPACDVPVASSRLQGDDPSYLPFFADPALPTPDLAIMYLGDSTWTRARNAGPSTAARTELHDLSCFDVLEGSTTPEPLRAARAKVKKAFRAVEASRTTITTVAKQTSTTTTLADMIRRAAASAAPAASSPAGTSSTLLQFVPSMLPPNLCPPAHPSSHSSSKTMSASTGCALVPAKDPVSSIAFVVESRGRGSAPSSPSALQVGGMERTESSQSGGPGMGDYQPSVDPFKVFRRDVPAQEGVDSTVSKHNTDANSSGSEVRWELQDVMHPRNWQALIFTALAKDIDALQDYRTRCSTVERLMDMLRGFGYEDPEMLWHKMQLFICRELPLTTWFKPDRSLSKTCADVGGVSDPPLTIESWDAGADGENATVLDSIGTDIALRNLFEIGLGNGLQDTTARGGWEVNLFGPNAYPTGTHPRIRPRYGVFNLANNPLGADAGGQYGSCYLAFRGDEAMRRRVTITPEDSSARGTTVATFDSGLASLFLHCSENALRSVASVTSGLEAWGDACSGHNGYREIQVHGDVLLHRHVTHLVISDSYVNACFTADSTALRGSGQSRLLQFLTIAEKNGWWLVPMSTMTNMAKWRLLDAKALAALLRDFSPELGGTAKTVAATEVTADSSYPFGPTYHLAGPPLAACRPLYDALCHRVCQATHVFLVSVATSLKFSAAM